MATRHSRSKSTTSLTPAGLNAANNTNNNNNNNNQTTKPSKKASPLSTPPSHSPPPIQPSTKPSSKKGAALVVIPSRYLKTGPREEPKSRVVVQKVPPILTSSVATTTTTTTTSLTSSKPPTSRTGSKPKAPPTGSTSPVTVRAFKPPNTSSKPSPSRPSGTTNKTSPTPRPTSGKKAAQSAPEDLVILKEKIKKLELENEELKRQASRSTTSSPIVNTRVPDEKEKEKEKEKDISNHESTNQNADPKPKPEPVNNSTQPVAPHLTHHTRHHSHPLLKMPAIAELESLELDINDNDDNSSENTSETNSEIDVEFFDHRYNELALRYRKTLSDLQKMILVFKQALADARWDYDVLQENYKKSQEELKLLQQGQSRNNVEPTTV